MDHCDEYWLLLNARLDGELSPDDARRLETHLAECPRCRQSAQDLEVLRSAMRDLPIAAAPADFKDKVMAAVAADNVVPFAPAKTPWKVWLSTAAVLAVIIGGALLFRGGPDFPQGTADLPLPADTSPVSSMEAVAKDVPLQNDICNEESVLDTGAADNTDAASEVMVTSGRLQAEDYGRAGALDAEAPAKNSAAKKAPDPQDGAGAAVNGMAEPRYAYAPQAAPESSPAATFRGFSSTVTTQGSVLEAPASGGEAETGGAEPVPMPNATMLLIPSSGEVIAAPASDAAESVPETECWEDAASDQPAPTETPRDAEEGQISSRQALELVVDHINTVNATPLTNLYADDESGLTCTNSLPGTNVVVNTVVYEGLTQDGDYYLFSVENSDQATDRYQVSVDGSDVRNVTP